MSDDLGDDAVVIDADKPAPVGLRNGGTRADLRKLAEYQRGIILCILINIGVMIMQLTLPPQQRLFVAIGSLGISVAAMVLMFLLANKVYGLASAILLAILTVVPCAGLIILLLVNQRVTKILTANQIKVGFLGANPRDITL